MSIRSGQRLTRLHWAGLAGVAAIVILLALLALGHLLSPGSSRSGPAGRGSAQPELSAESIPAGWITRHDTVRRGDTLSRLLLRNDLFLRDIERVVSEVRDTQLFDLRKLLPGETIEIALSEEGRLRQLVYHKGPDRIYVVEGDEHGLSSYRTGLPYDVYLHRYGGSITTTVDEALRATGADPAVIVQLAEVFASDIDFLTEPRAGDRVSVLVAEKRFEGERLGSGTVIFASYAGKRAKQTALRFGGDPAADYEGSAGYYTPAGESLVRTFLRSPLNYRRISSRFSHRRYHPILRVWRPHLGVDYAAPIGTPVVSIGGGQVTFAGWNGGFGRQVRVRHDSVYESCYGHLSRIAKGVRAGRRVTKGEVIGYVGSSGQSTGPHLDFRVKRGGGYIDPLRMQNPPTAPIAASQRPRFAAEVARLSAINDSLQVGEALLWKRADSTVSPAHPAKQDVAQRHR